MTVRSRAYVVHCSRSTVPQQARSKLKRSLAAEQLLAAALNKWKGENLLAHELKLRHVDQLPCTSPRWGLLQRNVTGDKRKPCHGQASYSWPEDNAICRKSRQSYFATCSCSTLHLSIRICSGRCNMTWLTRLSPIMSKSKSRSIHG